MIKISISGFLAFNRTLTTPAFDSQITKTKPVGAVFGGVIAGAAAVVLALLCLWYRRHQ